MERNSMKIGLIDVDGHNFPNLPLMKLSAWHKANGDSVEWYNPLWSGHMDRVYMSKVFSFTPDYEYFIDADEVYRGGQWVLHYKRRRKRALCDRMRPSVAGRNRTYLSRLFHLSAIQRHCIWFYDKRMPKTL